MSDETRAGILTAAWAVGIIIGGIVNGAVGAVIAIASTLIFAVTLYSSWLIERTEKRLSRYVKSAGQNISKEINGKSEPKWWV